jgi:hypothetical protein
MVFTKQLIVVLVAILAVLLAVLAIVIVRRRRSSFFREFCYGFIDYLVLLGKILAGLALFLVCVALANILGIALGCILLYAIIEVSRRGRMAKQQGLLWLLTVATERSMPLIPIVESFAQENHGRFRWKARRLAKELSAGVALPDALQRVPGLLPRGVMPTIRIGHETGTIAKALRRAATAGHHDLPIWAALQGKIAYLLLLPAFGLLTLMYIMLKIVPSFEKIFRDFGSQLPDATHWLIRVSNLSIEYWYLCCICPSAISAGPIGICRECRTSRDNCIRPRSSTPWRWLPINNYRWLKVSRRWPSRIQNAEFEIA